MISAALSITLSLIAHAEFTREMTIRELKGVNKGALLGTAWLVISPLIQVAAYVIIVSFVFQRKLDENSGSFDYAIYVLSGMIPWQLSQYSLSKSPMLVRERIDVVKQTVYPIETLPITTLAMGTVGSLVSFCIYLLLVIVGGEARASMLLLPIPSLLLFAFLTGVSWIFMIVGVIVKDLREIVSLILGLLVFVSPVIASETLVGPRIWQIIQWNPLSHVVICFRDVFLSEFHAVSWIVFVVTSSACFLVGSWVVMKTKVLINEFI